MFFIGIFGENKYNIINRIKKCIAKIRNKDVEINFAFEYKNKTDFESIKKRIKEKFKGLNIKKNSPIRMDFTLGVYSINIINNQKNNIFIEIERMSCGINGLKEKVTELLSILNELSSGEQPILDKFLSCDIDISLPYKWNYVNINHHKQFKLKKYMINLEDKKFKSEIEVKIEKINVKLNTKEAILPILEKFI